MLVVVQKRQKKLGGGEVYRNYRSNFPFGRAGGKKSTGRGLGEEMMYQKAGNAQQAGRPSREEVAAPTPEFAQLFSK